MSIISSLIRAIRHIVQDCSRDRVQEAKDLEVYYAEMDAEAEKQRLQSEENYAEYLRQCREEEERQTKEYEKILAEIEEERKYEVMNWLEDRAELERERRENDEDDWY